MFVDFIYFIGFNGGAGGGFIFGAIYGGGGENKNA